MIALILSWICIGWLSLVLGVAVLRGLRSLIGRAEDESLSIAPDYILLFGFAISTFLVSLTSLVYRINWEVNVLFLLFGIFLHFRHRNSIEDILLELQKGWQHAHLWLKLSFGMVILVALSATIIEVAETDTWFYHAQSMQWIKEFGVVPGLGNVHGRFAFNSNYFVISSFYAFWFSPDQVLFPLGSFFFILLSFRLLVNLEEARAAGDHRWLVVYGLLMLLFSYQSILLLSSTSTDLISCILIIYIFLLFFDTYQQKERDYEELILWSMVALSVTFKLSSLIIVVMLLPTLPRVFKTRRFIPLAGIAILIGLPFIARNIILSGYILYPFPDIDVLTVDWKIPIEEVKFEKDLVEGWAKQPYGSSGMEKFEDILSILEYSFTDWIKVWWPAQSLKWKFFMLLSLLHIPLIFFSWIRKEYRYTVVFAALALNLLFWFDQAPQPRFAYGFLFFGAALILGYLGSPIIRWIRPKKSIFIVLLLALPALFVIREEIVFTNADLSVVFLPKYETEIKTQEFAAHNFTLNIPSEEPPASIYWCYNSPLPCTPLPKENLEMRGDTYKHGFRIRNNTKTISRTE